MEGHLTFCPTWNLPCLWYNHSLTSECTIGGIHNVSRKTIWYIPRKLLPSRSQMNISSNDPRKKNHLHSRSMQLKRCHNLENNPSQSCLSTRVSISVPPFIWKCPLKSDHKCPLSYPFSCKSPELHAMLIWFSPQTHRDRIVPFSMSQF